MKKLVVVFASAFLASMVWARDLSWCGSAEGNISDSANWRLAEGGSAVPQPGDTLTVDGTVAITGNFDLGDAGLTIVRSGSVKNYVVFSGAGKLQLRGTGNFRTNVSSAHTGGVIVHQGVAEIGRDSTATGDVYGFGTGPIDVYAGNGASLVLSFAKIGGENAPVRVYGSKSSVNTISLTNNSEIQGDVIGDDSVFIHNAYGILTVRGGITVPDGKAITFSSNAVTDDRRTVYIYGAVNGNIAYRGARGACVRLAGESVNPNNEIHLSIGGYLSFETTARWAGQVITATGANIRLLVASMDNLLSDASISLDQSAKMTASSITYAGQLTVDGVEIQNGVYSNLQCPDFLEGNGLLAVGVRPAQWIGEDTGLWSIGSNWSTGTAPCEGQIALFSKVGSSDRTITLGAETFDFGAGGIALCVDQGVTINQKVNFAGSGGYTKYGAGTIAYQASSTYTGQTVIADGIAVASTRGENTIWGMNPVVRALTSATKEYPRFVFGSWGVRLPYTLRFEGAMKSATTPRILIQNNIDILQNIESDSDFYIQSNWGPIYLRGNISAPGHTVRIFEKNENNNYSYRSEFYGEVNATVDKYGAGWLGLYGISPNPDNKLLVNEGRVTLGSTAQWGGVDVRVGATGKLELNSAQNLNLSTFVQVATGGKISVKEGVCVNVGDMSVGGNKLFSGLYTSRNLPAVIEGTGRILVGVPGTMIMIR